MLDGRKVRLHVIITSLRMMTIQINMVGTFEKIIDHSLP